MVRDEGRPVRPAIGSQELARARQVRHAGRARRSTSMTRRPRRCSACPTAIAATVASGLRMRSQFATALADQEGVLDQFQQAMQAGRREVHQAAAAQSRCACSTRPRSGTVRASSSGRTSTAGTTMSPRRSGWSRARRGRSRSRKAATTSVRKQLRAPDQPAPSSPSHERGAAASSQPRGSGR